jgi:hypothetical protein
MLRSWSAPTPSDQRSINSDTDAPAQGLVRSSSHTRPIHLSPGETRPIATGESERSNVPLRKFA